MRRTTAALFTLATLVGLLASPVSAAPLAPADPAPEAPVAALGNGQVQLQLITSGLSSPVGVVNADDS